ncbi:hypothetical protein QAD02_005221 [Eretmocerus hayati]|uniref:Uncharacterized protein n=1 Tax=Eretmocerus hayati TaxID=131215 RepID=A0ACC2NRS5_9HYME|nr:hypothetical protein QAD02_005221 [Eretmocerus hayati]
MCGVIINYYDFTMKVLNWVLNILGISSPPSTEYEKIRDGAIENHTSWTYLNSDECGSSVSSRIVGGKAATIGQFPWMARLGYIEGGSTLTFQCGGSVISERYIVTAAHCVAVPSSMKLTLVRLGEHDTETNPDCNGSFCNDPYVDVNISKALKHENYNRYRLFHDIALLRLSRKVNFTNFVKPICLLKSELLKRTFTGQRALTAGWGIYNITAWQKSTVLQQVMLPVLGHKTCASTYGSHIKKGQMCAGGEIGRDSCAGDSGGPLMYQESFSHRYYLIGVVSYGPSACGAQNVPAIYTRVSEYVLWILNNISP